MAEIQAVQLALPAPRVAAVPGLRATLRSAAAIPVNPVEPVAPPRDATFDDSVRKIASPSQSLDEQASGRAFAHSGPVTIFDGNYGPPPGSQFGPFVAQQIGQHSRVITPTLVANVEVGAYAAAQARVTDMTQWREHRLDIRA